MKKRDVLLLCQFFYPEYVSSATLPRDTAEALVQSGLTVDVLCGTPKEYSGGKKVPKKEVYNGIYIKRMGYLQLKRTGKLGRLINYFSFLVSAALRLFSLRHYRCVMVYSNPPVLPLLPAVASRLFKTKLVFVAYDIYPELALLLGATRPGSAIDRFTQHINRKVYSRAACVVALSQEMKRLLLSIRPQLSADRVAVIPNWYDDTTPPDTLHNPDFRTLSESGKTVVVYAGNMGVCQDMNTIFEAANLLQQREDIVFLFAGHGSKLPELKKRAAALNLPNVRFYDFLLGRDYIELLALASCHVVSLEKGVEGLSVPSKTYSYLAIGRPVIAIMQPDTDIARELNEYGAGYCIPQGDVQRFVNAVCETAEHPEKAKQMGENAHRLFKERYTKELCTQQYVKLIHELLC